MERSECLAFLRARSLGRIGLGSRALPMIEPVRAYHVVRDEILIHVPSDSGLEEALRFDMVSFQVDDLRHDGTGQSVVVVGRASPAPASVYGFVDDAIKRGDEALFVLRCELIAGRSVETTRQDPE